MRLDKETIEKGLICPDKYVQMAVIKNCQRNSNLSEEDIIRWTTSDVLSQKIAAIFFKKGRKTSNLKETLDQANALYGHHFACEILGQAYRSEMSLWASYPSAEYGEYYTSDLVKRAIGNTAITGKTVEKWLQSGNWCDELSALYSCIIDPVLMTTSDILEVFNRTMDKDIIEAAIIALRTKELPASKLQSIYNNADSITKRVAATKLFYGRKEACLEFNIEELSKAEIEALNGLYQSKERIDAWWKNDNPKIQAMAIYSSKGKEMPYAFYSRALRSTDPILHEAGLVMTYGKKGYNSVRQLEPDKVYKKCVGGVVLMGTIPKNASIRATGENQGRASRFFAEKIVEGDFLGREMGVAFYDCLTMYEIRKGITVLDFDPSCKENTTGIHFFLNQKDAHRFYY